MTADELRKKYMAFFVSKGHTAIPSASLVPKNDPTVLFTTAGMHPLVPFLQGEPHPAGKRLVNVQRCIRTGDIDLVGDDTHLTFFEMLGNWSLGDYWKEDAIKWSWEFLTKVLKLDKDRIYITCFAGDKDAPKDEESAKIWEGVGAPKKQIAFLGKDDNWWGPAGQTGPCGPDTEMFYQVNTTEDDRPGDVKWPKGKYVEIWNDVFMQYNKTADGIYEELKQKNVDTGMGLERTLTVLQNVNSVYETDVLKPMMDVVQSKATSFNEKQSRIIVDHLKAAMMIIADGVMPSNVEQGYVVRRLIRRSIRLTKSIELQKEYLYDVVSTIATVMLPSHDYLKGRGSEILNVFREEEEKFSRTLEKGLKVLRNELIHSTQLSPKTAFDLYQTYGFPKELIEEETGQTIDDGEWEKQESQHRNLSRKGAAQKFAGGLADHSETVVRMHTATHLLHQALRDVLGDHVQQKGSNITEKRLRFDFTHPEKMTDEQKKKVEDIVNEKIAEAFPVVRKEMPIEEARKLGAIGLFGEKYGDTVSVYQIGDYSKEFCGGPHVKNTGEIKHFRILKEESSSAGVRRIKAVLG